MASQFLPFVTMTSDPILLRWTRRFASECAFRNGPVVFSDAQMDANGRWLIQVGTLSTFVKTAKVPNSPQLRAEIYAAAAHASVRAAETTQFDFFCGAAIPLASMRNHVVVHLQKEEMVPHLPPLVLLLPGLKFSPKRKPCPARAQSGPSPLPSKVLRSVAR